MRELPPLPKHLTSLRVSLCSALEEISDLPDTLEKCIVIECDKLTKVPDSLLHLTKLIKLKISWCRTLKTLPSHLPSTLDIFDISGCRALTALPALPNEISKFYLTNCSDLEEISYIPPNATCLDLLGCCSLRKLPESLSDGLKLLNLTRCVALEKLPSSHAKELVIIGNPF
jgi:hypothetical protein